MSSAHHLPVNMIRWLKAQKWSKHYWSGAKTLARERVRLQRTVLPIIQHYGHDLENYHHILDVGCGPLCAAQYIEKGTKTYVDSLLDDYRRAYPRKLPKGDRLCSRAEELPLASHSMDMVLCINALDHMQNPELVLSELHRIIRPTGLVLISMFVYPVLIARLYYYLEHSHLPLIDRGHPYNYSYRGIKNTLERYFHIRESRKVKLPLMCLDVMPRHYYMFVCEVKS
ncbi:MAG: class I SAM-dependent methyltransferase [Mariprofundaceae bacterium]|nr:class I SAM-dependent methyltransferase [Mariprofundaceae bacterium]